MKKSLAILLTAVLLAGMLSGCGKKNAAPADPDSQEEAQSGQDSGAAGNTQDTSDTPTNPEADPETPDANTPSQPGDAQQGADQNHSQTTTQKPSTQKPTTQKPSGSGNSTSSNPGSTQKPQPPAEPEAPLKGKSLTEIVDLIYGEKSTGLTVGTTAVDISDADALKYNTGLDSADLIGEAVVSEALIGSQAYSMAVVRVKDSADAKTVANAMKSGINTAKWICVQADDLRVAAKDDVVVLVMISSELSDTVTAGQLISAFQKVSGGSLSVDI